MNAVFWILRTGAPWRDLPPDYGGWSNTHRRFIRWRDKDIWERLLEQLIDAPDFDWFLIDASHIKSTRMRRVPGEAIKTWPGPKGAQHQDTLGRGCVWSAGPSYYYSRYLCGLQSGHRTDGGNLGGPRAGRSRL